MDAMDDDQLHGNDRRIENASEGVIAQINRTATAEAVLNTIFT